MPVIEPNESSRICLATVTSDSFIAGTLVTLYSFLKHNKWFKGDIVIINDQLKPENREYLSQIYGRVRFLEVSPRLHNRVDGVIKVLPDFEKKRARFYSLETFGLREYDSVLFCDSDLLFRRGIRELFDMRGELVVCGDGFHYRGRPREWSLHPASEDFDGVKTKLFRDTFSAGLMMISKSLLTDDNYNGLLDLVDSRIYLAQPSELTDQMVLNICFSGRQHMVSAKYNYPLSHRAIIEKSDGLFLTDASVLHFNGPGKPWEVDKVLGASLREPAYIKAFEFWFESYIECLQNLYFRSKVFETPAG